MVRVMEIARDLLSLKKRAKIKTNNQVLIPKHSTDNISVVNMVNRLVIINVVDAIVFTVETVIKITRFAFIYLDLY